MNNVEPVLYGNLIFTVSFGGIREMTFETRYDIHFEAPFLPLNLTKIDEPALSCSTIQCYI